ncbi:S8 family peptidase [Paenibacillus spongiae]|uniref:S8 family serine peptidase n=1 Tax=Paenibacillus spongiae TaxID=2909671 RepID=A0ABY5S7Q4_9BACL|nr:S8 family serine peptidase [Paenibacillus spongiae]UVI29934.1 S8 family serine peptidase [Paenibacillus spongiae]
MMKLSSWGWNSYKSNGTSCRTAIPARASDAPPSGHGARAAQAPSIASAALPHAAWRALLSVLAALLLCSAPLSAAAASGTAAAPPEAPSGGPAQRQPAAGTADGAEEEPHSWLLKWRDPALAKPLRGTRVIHRQAEPAAVDVVRPADPGADTEEWLRRLRETPGVEYVHPNSRVTLLAAQTTNDPELPKQHYLDQIGAKTAWSTVHDQTNFTIALVDTGVDLDHPDLKDNLVPGTNLVAPGKPPEDDNGHGTSVAGVLAGEGDNGAGISGILWKAKIMPIKALDAGGYGDEERLGDAILYAVKNGARIVVLSVGLYRYSPYLEDIAIYAESKGVLLVAASGNDGLVLGTKAEVKYPAAYPSVLAVAGATPNNKPEPRSNPGSEIDIAAPWNVYTTAVGGGYKKEQGTSMAAPQAAAAAALIWAVHPEYKPYQVRELLRQSAKDIGSAGVDEATGYGLLQVDRAVTATLKIDAYEPNNTREYAKKFPLGTKITGDLRGGGDKDWYIVDAPYDGFLSLQFQGIVASGQAIPPVRMIHYAGDQSKSTKDTKLGNQTVEWKVKKGRNYIQLQLYDKRNKTQLPYLLTTSFRNSPDVYETNDKQYQAFTLMPRTQTLTGNFHQTGDRDWYVVHFENGGTLRVTATPSSVRIDPAIGIQRKGGKLMETDENGEGETEISQEITITPGTYYIRVHNAISSQASPTPAQYVLKMEYRTKYSDPNEPNNKMYEATVIGLGSDYFGVINKKSDLDWYQLRLDSRSIVTLTVKSIPSGVRMKAELYDKRQKLLATLKSERNRTVMMREQLLDPGVYYVKVTADIPFDRQYYELRMDADKVVSGMRDIDGHWAESPIVQLSSLGIIGGSGSYRFNPDRSITRAEAVSMLARTLSPAAAKAGPMSFTDVKTGHWANASIMRSVRSGWVGGYVDGTFKPDQPITREEMAVILSRAWELREVRPTRSPFGDVDQKRWSSAALNTMKLKNWVSGYQGNRFMPEETASRAEFAAVLQRALGSSSKDG